MPIQVANILVPTGGNSFFLLDDKAVRGSYRVAETMDDLNNILPSLLKEGCLGLALDDGFLRRYAAEQTWTNVHDTPPTQDQSETQGTIVLESGPNDSSAFFMGTTGNVEIVDIDTPVDGRRYHLAVVLNGFNVSFGSKFRLISAPNTNAATVLQASFVYYAGTDTYVGVRTPEELF